MKYTKNSRTTEWRRRKAATAFSKAALASAAKRKKLKSPLNPISWELAGGTAELTAMTSAVIRRNLSAEFQEEFDDVRQECLLRLWEVSGAEGFKSHGWRWAVAANTLRFYFCRMQRRNELLVDPHFFEVLENEIC